MSVTLNLYLREFFQRRIESIFESICASICRVKMNPKSIGVAASVGIAYVK